MAASSSNPRTTASSLQAALVPQAQHLGKPALPLSRAFTLVGSRHRAHLHLLSKSVSKSHAAIISTNSGYYIRDLASRERVIINGNAQREAALRHGDQIKIGSFAFQFSDPLRKSSLDAAPRAREAELQVEGSNIPVPLDGRTMVIGRRQTADISLIELSASTIHAIIFEIDGQRYIRDLGSRTGTFVNGRPIHHHPLAFNDTIKVGDTELRYVAVGAPAPAEDVEQLFAGELSPPAQSDVIPLDDLPAPIEVEPEADVESPARAAARRALEEVNRSVGMPAEDTAPVPMVSRQWPADAQADAAPIPLEGEADLVPLEIEPVEAAGPMDAAAEAAHEARSPAYVPDSGEISIAPGEPFLDIQATYIPLVNDPAAIHSAAADINVFVQEFPLDIGLVSPPQVPETSIDSVHDTDIAREDAMSADFGQGVVDDQSPTAGDAPAGEESPQNILTTDAGSVADAVVFDEPAPAVAADEFMAAPAVDREESFADLILAKDDYSVDVPSPRPVDRSVTGEEETSPDVTPAEPLPAEAASPNTSSPDSPTSGATEAPIDIWRIPVDSEINLSEATFETAPPETARLAGEISEGEEAAAVEPEGSVPSSESTTNPVPDSDQAATNGAGRAAMPLADLAMGRGMVEPPVVPSSRKPRKKRETTKPAKPENTPSARGRKKKTGKADPEPVVSGRRAQPGVEAPPAAGEPEFVPIEVLPPTEPSPDSAQTLEPSLEMAADAIPLEPTVDESIDSLTDSRFGRAVEEFAGSSIGPLVEPRAHQDDSSHVATANARESTGDDAFASEADLDSVPAHPDDADLGARIDNSLTPPVDSSEGFSVEPVTLDHFQAPMPEVEGPAEGILNDNSTLTFAKEGSGAEPFIQPAEASATLDSPVDSQDRSIPASEAPVSESHALVSHDPAPSSIHPADADVDSDRHSFTVAPEVGTDTGTTQDETIDSTAGKRLDFTSDQLIEPILSSAIPMTPALDLPFEPEVPIEESPVSEAPGDTAPPASTAQASSEDLLADELELGDRGAELSAADLDWVDAEDLPAIEDPTNVEPPSVSAAPSSASTREDISGVEELSFDEAPDDLAGLMPATRAGTPPAPASPPHTAQPLIPPSAPPVAPPAASAAANRFSVDDLMSGMSRDIGSFLGGLPLPIAAPPAAGPPKGVVIAVKKEPPVPPGHLKSGRAANSPSDSAIFDSSPGSLDELPDALEQIGDETDVLGAASKSVSPASGAPPRPIQKNVQPRPFELGSSDEDMDLADLSAFGPAPRASAGAFDGLAIPPRQQVDVFSMLPAPSADDPFLGAAGQSSKKPGAGSMADPKGRVQRPAHPPVPARQTLPGGAAPPSEAGQKAISAEPAPPLPPKRKRFKFFGILLASVGLAGATYAYWPAPSYVHGTLHFDGMERGTEIERRALARDLASEFKSSGSVVQTASDAVAADPRATSPGFLANPVALDQIASTAAFVNGSDFVITRRTLDPAGDRIRMARLLASMYEHNIHLRDDAASVKENRRNAQAQLDSTDAQLTALRERRKNDATAAMERQGAGQAERASFEHVQLAEKNWLLAAQKAKAIQDELEQLQAGALHIESDSRIKELAASLKQAAFDLSKARNEQGQDIGKDAGSVSAALAAFQKQVESAQQSIPPDSPLSPFLAAALPARQQSAAAVAELVERQKVDSQNLSDLKARLAEQSNATLNSAFAADPQLTDLQQQLALLKRRANTASDSNLADEAKRLDDEADAVMQQIARRRDALAAAAGPQRQKLVDDSEKQVHGDRAQGLARLREPLDLLTKSMPPSSTVPADQRPVLEALMLSLQQVRSASQQLAIGLDASSSQGQARIAELDAQRAELAGKLEARRQQVARENGNPSDNAQLADAIVHKQQELQGAQSVVAHALEARNVAHMALERAQSDLARIPAPASSLAADDAVLLQMQQRRQQLNDDLTRLNSKATIVPIDPATTANAIDVELPDPLPRVVGAAGVLVLGMLTAGFLAMRSPTARKNPANAFVHPVDPPMDFSPEDREVLAI